MTKADSIRIGIVGASGRGSSFKRAFELLPAARVEAVCDMNPAGLDAVASDLGAAQAYTDYGQMLDRSALDAVIVATPMPLHVEQSIAALQRDLHVLCEVPAAVSVAQCKALVQAAAGSKATFMMAENYAFLKQNVMVAEMVRRGEFGRTYFGEGEYIHELKAYNPVGGWRRRWQTGVNGITYGTHSLGPLLRWMPGDRVTSVSCVGGGRHHRDDAGVLFENESPCVMLGRMRSGGLVKVRVDMLSHRPHAMNNYQLQGIDGCYESARSAGEIDRVWLRSRGEPEQWLDLNSDALVEEFLPTHWKNARDGLADVGHGGGDFFELLEFIEAVTHGREPSIGIHEAMDMTLPGLVSQDSIAQDGRWLDVPDSRQWLQPGESDPQLRMTWPHGSTPLSTCETPGDYRVRQMTDDDEQACAALLDHVGFSGWTRSRFRALRGSVLPGGGFVVEHQATGRVVAMALAQHAPHPAHPEGGQLGWVAVHPDHRGRGLAGIVCGHATRRLFEVGYREPFLLTDDFRLPAIATYLRLGWVPVEDGAGTKARWDAVRHALDGR